MNRIFAERKAGLEKACAALGKRKNEPVLPGNGIFTRYRFPVLTADHVPLDWRYDLDPVTNPLFIERLPVNAVFNAGAITLNDAYCLVCRVEGADRKSFFAVVRGA